ncbi:hypothetical protein B296_00031324 [Ensete ventricosum]|uniref:non-specific serine/threonine protein kinase n=1 Tax=Ensete ventricosum TaxID=4639 RepID=A0A426YGX5_ENSVE|nr:hypothetical protein B296_00031324 [Ensete ventricosum]
MGNSCRGSFGSKYHRRSSAEPAKPPPSKCHHQSERSSVPDDSPKKPPKQQREAAAAVIMRRGFDPNSNYVLGHKTPNIRDLYILGRKLGQGQFGTTYLCTEIATGNDYACKSIAKRKLISKEDVEDVRREIQIMHHLSGHKNVVTIKGAYEDALYVHIVMELCSGGELFDRIIERGHFSERKAAELIRIIVGVVEACHSLGVMHRDLKPENFLLVNKDDDSSLKAIDFGLSVFFKPGQIFTDVVGSPYYVAPEVLCKHYGPEADVWTAGVILYILLSGVPPFWAGLSEEEIAGLREMFQAMDTDNSGSITFDELKAGLRRYGSTLKDTEIRDLMEAADVDNSGTIDYGEFIAATVHLNKLEREEHLVAAFSYFDKDGSGYITVDELQQACTDHNMTDTSLEDIIREVDQDNVSCISYKLNIDLVETNITCPLFINLIELN